MALRSLEGRLKNCGMAGRAIDFFTVFLRFIHLTLQIQRYFQGKEILWKDIRKCGMSWIVNN